MTQATRDPASYTDPNGYVFWKDQQVFRRIYPEKSAFFKALLAHEAIAALQADGHLTPTRQVEEGPEGLVLAHDTVWPLSYPQEWCGPMLQEAALTVLSVASRLAEAGYGLADGHPWNVLFAGPKPVFIDLGSITEAPERLLWPAEVQFNRYCLYPLHLYGAGLGEIARGRLQDLAQGVNADLALRTLPARYKLTRPGTYAKLKASQTAEYLTTRAESARSSAPKAPPQAPDPAMLSRIRRGYFAGIRREVEGLTIGKSGSDWARYYASCPSMGEADAQAKAALMDKLLDELSPKTVLDLGSNTGQYAMMAARKGARVVAVDQDEPTVAALYQQVRSEGLDVLPLVMDLGNPTPATGWCAEQRPDALARLRSELTLMLALIHHLVFTGNISFQQIARLAARSSKRHVVLEWVAMDDPMSRYLTRTTTKDFSFYTLPNMIAALEEAGFTVRQEAPHSATRQLLVCTRSL